MGRKYKFDGRTITSSFRIPEELFHDGEEYAQLRKVLSDHIVEFYEGFKERKRFKDKIKKTIHRGFKSFSSFS